MVTGAMLDRLQSLSDRFAEIEGLLARPEIATDPARLQELAKERASLEDVVGLYERYESVARQLEDARAILEAGDDDDLRALAHEEVASLESQRDALEDRMRLALLPKDRNDEKDVIVEIRAGTGGEEAALFVADLYRMYSRYAQGHGWKIEIMDANRTGIGGIKEIVLMVRGAGAYSRLKHESGTHRVQRVPTTESSGRIHTSAATVAVLPEAEEVDVEIRPEDIQTDIFHASGHGGQNVQKVATAVRITHKPTGIVATCQDESSQHKNREKAMAVLRARVLAREVERRQRETTEARRAQVGSGDRSERVRTYNFPERRVTDHRVRLTLHNLDAVLDGDVEALIEALIQREQEMNLEAVEA